MNEAYKTKHFSLEDLINLAFYGATQNELLYLESSSNVGSGRSK